MSSLVVVGNVDPELRIDDIKLTLPYKTSVFVTVAQYHRSTELREALERRQVLVLQGMVQPPQTAAVAAAQPEPSVSVEQLVSVPPAAAAPSPPILDEIHAMLKQLLSDKAGAVSMGTRVVTSPAVLRSGEPNPFDGSIPSFIPDIAPVVVEDALTVKTGAGSSGLAESANALRKLRKKS